MKFNYRNAHVRDFCHGISLRTPRESGAYGVSRRTAAADCSLGIPLGTVRRKSPAASTIRQRQPAMSCSNVPLRFDGMPTAGDDSQLIRRETRACSMTCPVICKLSADIR